MRRGTPTAKVSNDGKAQQGARACDLSLQVHNDVYHNKGRCCMALPLVC